MPGTHILKKVGVLAFIINITLIENVLDSQYQDNMYITSTQVVEINLFSNSD